MLKFGVQTLGCRLLGAELKTKTTEDIPVYLPDDDQPPLHVQVPPAPHDVAAGLTEGGIVPEQGATPKLDRSLQSKKTRMAEILWAMKFFKITSSFVPMRDRLGGPCG